MKLLQQLVRKKVRGRFRLYRIGMMLLVVVCTANLFGSGFVLPAGATSSNLTDIWLNDIACPSTEYCVAVGSASQQYGSTDSVALIRQGADWQAMPVPATAEGHQGTLRAVDCTAKDHCVAVGSYQRSGRYYPWITVLQDDNWQTIPVQSVTNQTTNQQHTLSAVSCEPLGYCLAGGTREQNDGHQAIAYELYNETWQTMSTDQYNFSKLKTIAGIDCFAPQTCHVSGASDGGSHFLTSTRYAFAEYMAGTWQVESWQPEEATTVRTFGQFQDLDCPAIDSCTAIANGWSEGTFAFVRKQAQQLTVAYPEILPSQQLDAISWNDLACGDIETCVVVGDAAHVATENVPPTRAIVGVQSSTGWQTSTVQAPEPISQARLEGVACVSNVSCTAAGYYYDQDDHSRPMVAVFNGVSWEAFDPLRATQSQPVTPVFEKPTFVAFGDSLTTGESIASCRPHRGESPWGCTNQQQAATPYPDWLASVFDYSYSQDPLPYREHAPGFAPLELNRVGIWGYSVQEAAEAQRNGRNYEGDWVPQLTAIEDATELVTGALGINDLQFSDIFFWAKKYYRPGGDHITPAVEQILAERSADFDQLFESLTIAKNNGAKVVVTLYYNPYDTAETFCGDLENIGDAMVGTLNNELSRRAHANDLQVADFRPAFQDRGSGAENAYVFGTECKPTTAVALWLPRWLKQDSSGGAEAVAEAFDPHPNDSGTLAMAQVIFKEMHHETQ